MTKAEQIKKEILRLTEEYYKETHAKEKPFIPGETFVNYGGCDIRHFILTQWTLER